MQNIEKTTNLVNLPVENMINTMVSRSQDAFKSLRTFDQKQVDTICEAIADTARRHAKALAQLAYRETGRGNYEDKAIKNIYASQYIWNQIKDDKTVGIIKDDPANGLQEIAEPLGVVAGVTPVTNPTSTVIFKILLALKTRNTIIFGLHPQAQQCGSATCRLLAQAAEQAGAPKDCIQWIPQPSIEATDKLMNHPNVAIVLATGGPAMVAAAYSTGKPALGVGPGNAPAYIEASADVDAAVQDIMTSKTFDNGMICASENSVVVDRAIYQKTRTSFEKQGAYFVPKADTQKLSDAVIDPKRHTVRGPIAGQSAERIAEIAGIQVPKGTKLLIAEVGGIGVNFPLSGEKLSPVLTMYEANGHESAMNLCLALLEYGGLGHTAVLHTKDQAIIDEFGVKMPACRILINTPGSLGGIGGLFNKLTPSLTLGTGSYGKNSISHNLTDRDLLNIKTISKATRHPLDLIAELRDLVK
ncbi:aldehyde dehydrogenase family protein [Agrilactobacillus fermenti]|uniref:aldehyde dehydrogenase family protein n=1 Tax=Agrilactobacillus fermenti TaxID=2586909 RepID=UPI001E4CDE0A|nr:aldehyde dehydrogenase family protein [Agrilactobacillus fermenti]MCD2256067.1 aldehyde dehydrogenase family protein [Agrilactobacillus fermenti]